MAKRLVVDSSVALKWWLDDEEFVEEARAILKKVAASEIELVVLGLWFYEIANGLNVAVRRQRISSKRGAEFVEELQAIEVTQIPVVSQLGEIFQAAQKYNCFTAHLSL
ncbi:MAG: type II toxin-antitoxin system VapC family toxin [bacterium]